MILTEVAELRRNKIFLEASIQSLLDGVEAEGLTREEKDPIKRRLSFYMLWARGQLALQESRSLR